MTHFQQFLMMYLWTIVKEENSPIKDFHQLIALHHMKILRMIVHYKSLVI